MRSSSSVSSSAVAGCAKGATSSASAGSAKVVSITMSSTMSSTMGGAICAVSVSSVKIRVDAGIGLVGQVGGMRTSSVGSRSSAQTTSSTSDATGLVVAVGFVSDGLVVATTEIRVDMGIGLVGKIGRVRAGSVGGGSCA